MPAVLYLYYKSNTVKSVIIELLGHWKFLCYSEILLQQICMHADCMYMYADCMHSNVSKPKDTYYFICWLLTNCIKMYNWLF